MQTSYRRERTRYNRPMIRKIALVTDGWHPVVDGVVRALDTQKQTLEKRGIEVFVIHPGLFRTVPMPFDYQVRLSLFPRKRMRQLLTSQPFDAIHVATEGTLGWAARAVCRSLQLPYTTAHHTNLALYVRIRVMRGLDALIYAYLRKFHSRAARLMLATGTLRDNLASHGFKNLAVVPFGVDTDLFKPNPNAAPLPYPKPIFTYMGRLAPEKNVEEFLQLDLPGSKLVIGRGESEETLKTNYPNAVFLGYKDGQELADLLSSSDVFVFPSRTETFGLSILEALACGVPAVAHDEMGPRDIITDGVDGFLTEDLKGAAMKALSLPRDACRQKALQYTWNKGIDAFVANLAVIPRK